MAHSCTYEGSKETCLLGDGYPVTKGGKLNCGRVRNAAARGSQQGVLAKLKSGGLCSYMKKCGASSDVCGSSENIEHQVIIFTN